MRKTLFALLGLVAIGMWAVPALAGPAISHPPKVSDPIPLENRPDAIGAMARNGNNYQATLSGSIIKQANVSTSWFLYEGACLDRQNGPAPGLGSWVARTAPQSDSLDAYSLGTKAGYEGFSPEENADLSQAPKLIGVVDAATTASERPAILTGSRSIWFGKYDPNWVVQVGYPNITSQILYMDLESDRTPITSSAGTYTLSMKMNFSLEQAYDFMYLCGGDGRAEDPLKNDQAAFDQIRSAGGSANGTLIGSVTGSVTGGNPVSSTLAINHLAPPLHAQIVAEGGTGPANRTLSFTFETDFRAVYLLITADCLFSSEDGLWPFGNGVVLDDITVHDTITSATRTIYAEQPAAGGVEPAPPVSGGGDILVAGDPTGDGVRISARVFPGKGDLYFIQQGNTYATGADICAPQKSLASDRFFLGTDVSTPAAYAVPGQYNAIVSCTFPVPAGTADITALWGSFLNIPRTSGYVQQTEYRVFIDPPGPTLGSWSNWNDSNAGGGVVTGAVDQWFLQGDQLAQAVQADSFQVRYVLQCIEAFAVNRQCNSTTPYAVLYDDLFLQVTEGVPAPVIGIFPGSVAQTTFIDGFMTGVNCLVGPCWPGVRGSDLQTNPNIDIARSAVKDNLNSPLGDSLTMGMVTGLRKNGMGINWQFGYRKEIDGGLTIAVTNGSYNSAFDTPRVIYRLFDPGTLAWSGWDSTSLDANYISLSGDTVVIDSEYRMNWPPRDKLLAAASFPGGFTLNDGVNPASGLYSDWDFLPRGARMQYYFKAVDINGGTTYAFGAGILPREVEDLPNLPPPGTALVAPDIQEFNVLPRKYPAGDGSSLLAAKTDTPILNLDDGYGGWSFGQDPVTAALRGMGVRADRWRFLGSGDESHKIGGHELAGYIQERQSNYFPNMEEYAIVEALRGWYRILIENTHLSTVPAFENQDAALVSAWATTSDAADDGDRCIFLSGDDASNAAVNTVPDLRDPADLKLTLSNNVFGIANVTTLAASAAKGAWAGRISNQYPTIDDQFAAQSGVAGLATPGTFTYETDAGCPGPNSFDPLTATGGAFAGAKYPFAAGVTDVASVAKASEFDIGDPTDFDRVKTLAYGFSIQYVRGAPNALPRNGVNYVRSGVVNRMQILYKFLTGCRGGRGAGLPACWPCPNSAPMMSNWAAAPASGAGSFETTNYGPLMPIQDFTKATGIEVEEASAAPRANRLYGNSPNPFNPLTQIKFSAAQAGKVTIRIFNVAGQLVRTLETKVNPNDVGKTASVSWDGKSDRNIGVPSGVFFYKATFANGITLPSDKNMVLVK